MSPISFELAYPSLPLEPAIKHYFGPKRAPLPSPTNAVKSFIASFVSSILSSREASTGSGSQATVSKVFTNLPPVSSLHSGKPVSDFHFIFGTISFKLKSIPMNIGPGPVVIPTNGPKESASTKVVPSDRPHSVGMSSAQGGRKYPSSCCIIFVALRT